MIAIATQDPTRPSGRRGGLHPRFGASGDTCGPGSRPVPLLGGTALIHYEAYEEMAEQVMTEIAAELKARYELCEIAIHHRTGRVEIGEASVVIAVSAPHRQDALAACKDAIDTLKERVPLWKKEFYEGGEEWIGRGS